MPTVTHTLEGPDLEALLARVPQEGGPDATIVAANKLRSGGFAGFFAKEVFEVVVEVPEGARRPAAAAAPAAADTTSRTRRAAPLTADPAKAEAPTPIAKPVATQPRISTEDVGFAGVLDRMVRDAGLDDYAPRPVGPALKDHGRPSAEAESILDLESTDDSDSDAAAEAPFVLGLPELAAPAPQPGHVDSFPLPVETPQALPAPVAAAPVAPAAVAEVAAPAPVAAVAAPTAPVAPVAPAPTALVPAEPLLPAAPTGIDRALLTRIGIPAALLQDHDAVQDDPTVELLRLMARLQPPAALPSGTGSVIAVVGPRAEALELATALALQVGTDPDEVMIATSRGRVAKIDESRRIDSVDGAAERCRSWRRRRRPTIVAVESPYGRRQTSWAMELLDAIEPAMVWGVVEATSKPEDITTWAERVGGVDALAVNGLADTSSPAAVLSTGVPVGLLDGEEATPLRWTSILSEHLELAA